MDMNSIGLVVLLGIVITGIVKGWGENRSVVIFRDFDDLGLTFLVPASFVLIVLLFDFLKADPIIGYIVGGGVSLWLCALLLKQTYDNNQGDIGKTLLAFATKLPLAVLWVLNLFKMLNPGGRTAAQRSQSRGEAMIILLILTPIIGALVVDRSGSFFNPSDWIRGRRVGAGIRDHLR